MTIPAALRRALARVRRDVAFLLTGVPLHVVMLPLWVLVLVPKKRDWALAAGWLLLLPLITAVLTALQRGRYRALRGVYLPRLPDIPRRGPRRALAWLRSAAARRQAGYHLAGPALAAAELTVLGCWLMGAEVLALMAEGRSNAAIAAALVVSGSAVAKHINAIFTKLDLPPTDSDHRRVLAVLTFLNAPQGR